MNQRDSESTPDILGDDQPSGSPRSPQPDETESTQVRPPVPSTEDKPDREPETEEGGPILGVVVVYSETHEADPTQPDSRLGRVYPLKDGEILFVGRHPAPREVLLRNGGSAAPTYTHIFPSGGLYGYISGRHLTVEMDPLGGTILTDHSRYGVYLEKAKKWHRRKKTSDPPESHRVSGEETVTLMDDLGEPTDRDLADRRSRYQLHILRSPQASHDPMTETRA
ncbi:hypothetical protein ACFL6M_04255 [Candidatus Eisenbacteria bacterium]|uniref:FHA domain-containing protein n=1 Tax=Eiseniibacteriota bacterium TaxID=2212470 RepID=A0ABV6YKC0_UNCEI